MIKIKTAELIGAALRWAVAKADGRVATKAVIVIGSQLFEHGNDNERVLYEPDINWAQGGPIIERDLTEFDFDEDTQLFHAYDGVHSSSGPTHLIAAMRCHVVANLGDEVEVPEELLS